MPAPTLPFDQNDHPIQGVLSPAPGKSQTLTSDGATPAQNATGFDAGTLVVLVTAEVAGALKFGADNTVRAAATDHYIPANVPQKFSIAERRAQLYPYLSFLGNGKLHVTEMQ